MIDVQARLAWIMDPRHTTAIRVALLDAALAEAWDDGFESCFDWDQHTNGIPNDPPPNPFGVR